MAEGAVVPVLISGSASTMIRAMSFRTFVGIWGKGSVCARSDRSWVMPSWRAAAVASLASNVCAIVSPDVEGGTAPACAVVADCAGLPCASLACGSRCRDASPTSIESAGNGLEMISMGLSGQTLQGLNGTRSRLSRP